MTNQWGVWSIGGGGFVSTGAWSATEAERDRLDLIGETAPEDRSEASADFQTKSICPNHEEQPADACADCVSEGDE
jgi:hypothetical protein